MGALDAPARAIFQRWHKICIGKTSPQLTQRAPTCRMDIEAIDEYIVYGQLAPTFKSVAQDRISDVYTKRGREFLDVGMQTHATPPHPLVRNFPAANSRPSIWPEIRPNNTPPTHSLRTAGE